MLGVRSRSEKSLLSGITLCVWFESILVLWKSGVVRRNALYVLDLLLLGRIVCCFLSLFYWQGIYPLITLPIAHWCQPVIKLEQRHWALSYHIRVMIILGGIVMMK